ncbi:MAG TPA: hypothetical protein VHL59_04115 [Thermoanaerobaculia bacterium]|nr:hypothetical protein [Thermoanaerobaculia bacterium]
MSHALVIASRELRERSRVFLMCAGLALLPFLATLLPAARSDRATTIAMVSGFLALCVAFGTAAALGTSTIGADLVERRLSFYFSRPVSPASIWSGKAVAALLTSFLSFAIIAVPSMLAARQAWPAVWVNGGRLALLLGVGIVVVFLVCHTLGTMIRSRSAVLAIDFALATATAAAVYFILRPVAMAAGAKVVVGLLAAMFIGAIAILAAAPVWQLANGRTDIRRSHAALSKAIWIPMAGLLLLSGAFVAWLVSVEPEDLTEVASLSQASSGNTLLVSGFGRGRGDYHATFVVDAVSGEYGKLESPPWWGARFSRDGRVLAWMQPYSLVQQGRGFEIYTRELGKKDAKNVPMDIRVVGHADFALSADGSRIAVADGKVLTVYERASGRIIAAARGFEGRNGVALFFVSPDVVRLIEYTPRRGDLALIYELNIPTRKLLRTGKATGETSYAAISTSLDGSRLLIRGAGVIADGRSGATIATLPVKARNSFANAMMSDGTVAVVHATNGVARLYTFSRDGQPLGQVVLPGVSAGWLIGQIGDDRIVVGGWDRAHNHKTYVVDIARGAVERRVDGFKSGPAEWHEPQLRRFAEDQPIAGVDASGRVALWDPRTGGVIRVSS